MGTSHNSAIVLSHNDNVVSWYSCGKTLQIASQCGNMVLTLSWVNWMGQLPCIYTTISLYGYVRDNTIDINTKTWHSCTERYSSQYSLSFNSFEPNPWPSNNSCILSCSLFSDLQGAAVLEERKYLHISILYVFPSFCLSTSNAILSYWIVSLMSLNPKQRAL